MASRRNHDARYRPRVLSTHVPRMTEVEIRNFPMPPSANNLFANGKNGGRFKTQSYRAYELTVHHWALKNQHILNMARDLSLELAGGYVFRIDRTYNFRPSKIITKDGRPKRNDTSNRIKALDDCLSALIGIGDEYFWSGSYEKRAITADGVEEGVDIVLTLLDLSTLAS